MDARQGGEGDREPEGKAPDGRGGEGRGEGRKALQGGEELGRRLETYPDGETEERGPGATAM